MKKFTIIMSLFALILMTGSAFAADKNQLMYDEMVVCHISIQNNGNGQCAVPILNKLEDLNKAGIQIDFVIAERYRKCAGDKTCTDIIETIGHNKETYYKMINDITLAYACIEFSTSNAEDLLMCEQFK
jgi:hypothetical protein|tara:strand:+ start:51 stop:437 length:387 start_codon:yes stop_codon:yes gene_type:complete